MRGVSLHYRSRDAPDMSPTKGRDYVESASKVFYCIKNDLELWFGELKRRCLVFVNQRFSKRFSSKNLILKLLQN